MLKLQHFIRSRHGWLARKKKIRPSSAAKGPCQERSPAFAKVTSPRLMFLKVANPFNHTSVEHLSNFFLHVVFLSLPAVPFPKDRGP